MSQELGRSFGRAVEDYVRGRPRWPIDAIEATGVAAEARVLDLAAGTGKLTEVLAQRFAHVTAVEPDEAMRAANRWGEVLAGTAERIPLPNGAVDAVFVAEAFHWFGGPEVLREIARVLRPRGTLVLLWNRWHEDHFKTLPAVHDLLQALGDPAESVKRTYFGSGEWRNSFEGSPFGPIEEAVVEHEQVLDRAGLVSYFVSQSKVVSRPSKERAEIRAELERLIPEERYVRPLRSEVYWTRLR